ncbi:hypothetical protein OQA88_7286 [Cercophora sp. LCS_1]
MEAFDKVHVLGTEEWGVGPIVVVEAGFKTGDVIRGTAKANLTIPLGARPSVGMGLCLQGGIGSLARQHGLACDAIIGAVIVSVATGDVLYVGHAPMQHRLSSAVRPEHGQDLLWALKGAGSNFGIVLSLAFKAYPAYAFQEHHIQQPYLKNQTHPELEGLHKLPPQVSKYVYLYEHDGRPQLCVSVYEIPAVASSAALLYDTELEVWDGTELFSAEFYMSMHGHSGGAKTSSFKRCVFLKHTATLPDMLADVFTKRPSTDCYFHLIHGGGAIRDVPAYDSAFGAEIGTTPV